MTTNFNIPNLSEKKSLRFEIIPKSENNKIINTNTMTMLTGADELPRRKLYGIDELMK